MKISIDEFAALRHAVAVVIHSLDPALYQVTVAIEGQERLLVGSDGRPLRSRSLAQLRDVLARFPVASLMLRQQSAYDEMIGQAPREGPNILEVPLALPEESPPTVQ